MQTLKPSVNVTIISELIHNHLQSDTSQINTHGCAKYNLLKCSFDRKK